MRSNLRPHKIHIAKSHRTRASPLGSFAFFLMSLLCQQQSTMLECLQYCECSSTRVLPTKRRSAIAPLRYTSYSLTKYQVAGFENQLQAVHPQINLASLTMMTSSSVSPRHTNMTSFFFFHSLIYFSSLPATKRPVKKIAGFGGGYPGATPKCNNDSIFGQTRYQLLYGIRTCRKPPNCCSLIEA